MVVTKMVILGAFQGIVWRWFLECGGFEKYVMLLMDDP